MQGDSILYTVVHFLHTSANSRCYLHIHNLFINDEKELYVSSYKLYVSSLCMIYKCRMAKSLAAH